MKKIFNLLALVFISFYINLSFARVLPDIVAFVNDKPITKYDFLSKKKLIVRLNDIDISNAAMDNKLNGDILNLLIEETLVRQFAEDRGIEVTEEELKQQIDSIERNNKMPKNGLKTFLKQKNIPFNSFANQIRGEIIKNKIVGSLYRSTPVPSSEINLLISNDQKLSNNLEVEAWVFKSRDTEKSSLEQMKKLKKRLYKCDKMEEKLYDSFADAEKFDRKFSQLSEKLKSVVRSTDIGKTSNVYKEGDKFVLLMICKKSTSLRDEDIDKVKMFLSNQKTSREANKLLKELKSRADIRINM